MSVPETMSAHTSMCKTQDNICTEQMSDSTTPKHSWALAWKCIRRKNREKKTDYSCRPSHEASRTVQVPDVNMCEPVQPEKQYELGEADETEQATAVCKFSIGSSYTSRSWGDQVLTISPSKRKETWRESCKITVILKLMST